MLKRTFLPATVSVSASHLKSVNVSFFSVECIRSVVATNAISTTWLLFDSSLCVCGFARVLNIFNN